MVLCVLLHIVGCHFDFSLQFIVQRFYMHAVISTFANDYIRVNLTLHCIYYSWCRPLIMVVAWSVLLWCDWSSECKVVATGQLSYCYFWCLLFVVRHKYHHLTKTLHLTLKMTTAQLVETSVTNNSLSKDYPQPDDHTRQTFDTPRFKPFTINY